MEPTKKCCKCKELKSQSLFYKDSDRKDGLSPRCKKCDNDKTKKYYSSSLSKLLYAGNPIKSSELIKILNELPDMEIVFPTAQKRYAYINPKKISIKKLTKHYCDLGSNFTSIIIDDNYGCSSSHEYLREEIKVLIFDI